MKIQLIQDVQATNIEAQSSPKRTDINRLGETFHQPDILNEHVKLKIKSEKCTIKFRNMTSKRAFSYLYIVCR
jgi:hypothetical protein